jgi:hypothetical protein
VKFTVASAPARASPAGVQTSRNEVGEYTDTLTAVN